MSRPADGPLNQHHVIKLKVAGYRVEATSNRSLEMSLQKLPPIDLVATPSLIAQLPHDDDGAQSVPAAWRIGNTWFVRRCVTNSYGDPDIAEYPLTDDEIAGALCKHFGRSEGTP